MTEEDIKRIIIQAGYKAHFSERVGKGDGSTSTYVYVRINRRTRRSLGNLKKILEINEADLRFLIDVALEDCVSAPQGGAQ